MGQLPYKKSRPNHSSIEPAKKNVKSKNFTADPATATGNTI
jgi:hypothetical protein